MTLVGTVAVVLAIAGVPAPTRAADLSAAVSDVDSSTPGHVSAVVTTDAPWVFASSGLGARWFPVTDGAVPVELSTWGLPSVSRSFSVRPCPSQDVDTCAAITRTPYTPTNVTPAVDWPSQDRIGSALDPYEVSVSDPLGDGSVLRAGYGPGRDEEINRVGTTTLTLTSSPDGPADVVNVLRCDASGTTCTPSGAHSPGIVTKGTHVTAAWKLSRWFIATDLPDATLRHGPCGTGVADVSWSIERESEAEPNTWVSVPGLGDPGRVVDLDSAQDSCATTTVDVSSLPAGSYRVASTIAQDRGQYGVATKSQTNAFTLIHNQVTATVVPSARVINMGPEGEVIDPITITVTPSQTVYSRTQEIVDAAGHVVKRDHSPGWSNGVTEYWAATDDDQRVVAAGTYVVREKFEVDGGTLTVDSPPIRVIRHRYVTHTWARHVSAAGSLLRLRRAGCTTLSHGARGSIRIVSRPVCHGSGRVRYSTSTHQVRLPAAFRYDRIALSMDARELSEPKGHWDSQVTYRSAWGKPWAGVMEFGAYARRVAHFPAVDGQQAVGADRTFSWRARTATEGGILVLRGFTVRLTYRTIS